MNELAKSNVNESSDTSANETDKETYLRSNVPNTPYQVINAEDKYFVCLGNYRISEMFNTQEETEIDAQKIDWNRIITIITIAIRKIKVEDIAEILGENK